MSLSPAAGDQLGPYQLLSPLGEGGMGEVWRARDTRLDRTVALKVSKADFTERFEREARAVAALNHPNICTLHDVGPNYLVMELVDGAPLKGPLPVEKAVEYGGQILDALDAAHRKGITHRDLKPDNILVTKQGIKLLDFGLAKQAAAPLKDPDATLVAGLTGQGQIVGTLQYMSPEQLHSKEADARSDIFAFGCVLYEMLSGKRAFEGASAASVIAAILEREPAPLDVAPPLDRVIRKCLAKDPDERFQNARDLKYNLTLARDRPPAVARQSNRWLLPSIAAASLALGAFTHRALSPASPHTSTQQRAVRLVIPPPDGGQIEPFAGFAISPDGRTAAFVASVDGKSELWVRQLDGNQNRRLRGTVGARSPFWSPDGRSIAFSSNSKLFRVDTNGGEPVSICETSIRSGIWTHEGILVLEGRGNLQQVPAAGGTPLASKV